MPEPAVVPRPVRVARFALPVLLGLGLLTLAAAALLPVPKRTKPQPTAFTPEPAEVTNPVPDFTFTERSGQRVSAADLRGKVWVASFVFTRCTGPCPSVTATMARLQDELRLADRPDLRLVTFTLDPDTDTPDELKKYAANFRAHPDRWLFLTGPESQLHELAKNGFKLGVTRNGNPAAVPGEKYQHTTYLAVVDRDGLVHHGPFHGYQGPNDPDGERFNRSLADLKATVDRLLGEGGR
jgi:cytochrome oxidase Cu insertion factor (SCO1/SenC/PrrC family)